MPSQTRHDNQTKTGIAALFLLLLSGAVITAIIMAVISAMVPLWIYAPVSAVVILAVAVFLGIQREGFNFKLSGQVAGVGLFMVISSYCMGLIVQYIYGWYTGAEKTA
jgi:uncharacterized membrane protein